MKLKNIKISIKSDHEIFQEIKQVCEKLDQGEQVSKHEGISFDDLDTMRKILTDERLRILRTIRKENPQSIYELAKILQRDIKNTFDDVQFLAQVGLIELKKSQEGREKTMPEVKYDKILLEIPVL